MTPLVLLRTMNAEIDRELRKAESGKYLAEACKSDPKTDEAVEAAYKEA